MSRLSVYLTPFSPDYSGVASVFFDLDALAVLHDASGCTGTYTGYDEPRWYGSHYGAYCSGLREIDAILGNDEKLISKVIRAQKDIQAGLIAIIASPVPMVVGCDTKGIATEIESITGVPSFGFDTTGTEYYDKGMVLAAKALIDRFVEPRDRKNGINILGLDAIDFPLQRQRENIIRAFEDSGLEINAVFPAGCTMEKLRALSEAKLSIAVSSSGIETAKILERRFKIPYVIGLPYGKKGMDALKRKIEGSEDEIEIRKERRILVIGEAVSSVSIGKAISREFGIGGTCAVSMFTPSKNLSSIGCLHAESEKEIRRIIDEGWDLVIADPEFKALIPAGQRFFENPTYSISSKLFLDKALDLSGENFNRALAVAIAELE